MKLAVKVNGVASVSYPATVGQRLLWIMGRRGTDLGALNCPLACRLRGPLDLQVLQTAFDALHARHEALRSTFSMVGRTLMQLVAEPAPVPLLLIDLSHSTDCEAALQAELKRDFLEPTDPARATTRITVWRLGATDHVVSLTMHHLITDGWSCGVLYAELCGLYAWARGVGNPLPPVRLQHRDFARLQECLLAGTELHRHRAYWQHRLADAQLPAIPRNAMPQPTVPAGAGWLSQVVRIDLDGSLCLQIREWARAQRSTVFAALLAAFYGALHQRTGQRDLLVASLFTGRVRPELREIIGLLANMVILRTIWDPEEKAHELLRRTHETVMGALAYQELPYHVLPAGTLPVAAQGRADDVVFHLLADPGFTRAIDGLDIEFLVPDQIGSRFGIELVVVSRGSGFRVLLFTRRDWVEETWAASLLRDFVATVRWMVA